MGAVAMVAVRNGEAVAAMGPGSAGREPTGATAPETRWAGEVVSLATGLVEAKLGVGVLWGGVTAAAQSAALVAMPGGLWEASLVETAAMYECEKWGSSMEGTRGA